MQWEKGILFYPWYHGNEKFIEFSWLNPRSPDERRIFSNTQILDESNLDDLGIDGLTLCT
jgi:hypothetical protein